MKKIDSFTPTYLEDSINGKYYLFVLELNNCGICGKLMVDRHFVNYGPKYMRGTLEEQIQRAGICFSTHIKIKGSYDKYACELCSKEDKLNFNCYLCGEDKPTSKIKESYGDPSEHLCTDCYTTRSAKEWDKAKEILYDKHKYDFE